MGRLRNIPVAQRLFVGRASELAAYTQLLQSPDCRLLTLVGPGGIGKTALAIQIAYRVNDHRQRRWL